MNGFREPSAQQHASDMQDAQERRSSRLRRFGVLGLALLALAFACAPRVALGAEQKVTVAASLFAPVSIEGPVDGDMAERVAEQVKAAQLSGAKYLHVKINSPGGSVGAGLHIIETLRKSGMPSLCEVDQLAASMAAVILESSGCSTRAVHAHSVVMFHQASVQLMGTYTQQTLEAAAAQVRAINKLMVALVAPRLGMTNEAFEKLIDGRELWLVGVEVQLLGAADYVLVVPQPVQPS